MDKHWQVIENALEWHYHSREAYWAQYAAGDKRPSEIAAEIKAALAFVREMRRVPTERTPVAPTPQLDEAIATLQLVYRKHHLGDDRIGWDELSDKVLDTLSNLMGVEKLVEWQEGDTPVAATPQPPLPMDALRKVMEFVDGYVGESLAPNDVELATYEVDRWLEAWDAAKEGEGDGE